MVNITDLKRLSGVAALRENMESSLDDFTRGYVGTMLELDLEDEDRGEYDISHMDTASLQSIAKDCQKFQQAGAQLLQAAYKRGYSASDGSSPQSMAGYDFYLTRNGHGAGFWDRKELEGGLGDKLTELSDKFGEQQAYVGDDGQVYI